MRRSLLVLCAFALACAALTATAGAAPTRSPQAFTIPATCDGQEVEVVVVGEGTFSPGHVVGSTSVFVPYAIDVTFTFTPEGGGDPEVEREQETKPAPGTNLVTCELNFSESFPGAGTLTGVGTVTGFFAPR
jgi:hypothetical protein